MAFPTSPSNNQTALVNGIVYQWNSTLGVWKRNGSVDSITVGQAVLNSGTRSTSNASGTLIVSGGAGVTGNLYTGGIYITGSANGITFPDGTTQTTAGVAVDSYARTTANSATTLAQAAFDSANTKFNTSGGTITGDTVVTGNLTVTGTQFYANTVNMTVEDNIITLNSNVTGAPTLSAGIEVNRGSSTNTKLLWSEANSAWEFTNNGTTYDRIPSQVYANAAYAAANTNATNIGYVNTYAASAYTQANTNASNITIIQGVNTTQNTNITTVTTLAQAAFDKANTGSSGSSVLTSTVDTFTGNGSNTAFTLTVEPTNINYTTAVVGGVSQPRSAYSVVGTTLTFTSAPANGQIVEVTTLTTSNSTLYTVNNILSPFLLMGA